MKSLGMGVNIIYNYKDYSIRMRYGPEWNWELVHLISQFTTISPFYFRVLKTLILSIVVNRKPRRKVIRMPNGLNI